MKKMHFLPMERPCDIQPRVWHWYSERHCRSSFRSSSAVKNYRWIFFFSSKQAPPRQQKPPSTPPSAVQGQKVGSLTPPSSPKTQRAGHRRILSDVTHSAVFGVPASKSTQLLQAAAAEASLNKSKYVGSSPQIPFPLPGNNF